MVLDKTSKGIVLTILAMTMFAMQDSLTGLCLFTYTICYGLIIINVTYNSLKLSPKALTSLQLSRKTTPFKLFKSSLNLKIYWHEK